MVSAGKCGDDKRDDFFFVNTTLHTARCNGLILDLLCYWLYSLGYIIKYILGTIVFNYKALFFVPLPYADIHCSYLVSFPILYFSTGI